MTNSQKTGYGRVIMAVAVHLRGRTPIASAQLGNSLGMKLRLLEFQDGECVVIKQNLNHPKCTFKNGEMTSPGLSTFFGWESSSSSLNALIDQASKAGYKLLSSKRTEILPLLQMNLGLDQVHAKAA